MFAVGFTLIPISTYCWVNEFFSSWEILIHPLIAFSLLTSNGGTEPAQVVLLFEYSFSLERMFLGY